MHWYKKHIGDYRRRTSGLSLLGHGIYQQLIDNYYLTEGPLALDKELLYFDLGANSEIEQKTVDMVLKKFFKETSNGWYHKHCEEVLEPYRAKCKQNKENAKTAGRKPAVIPFDDSENQINLSGESNPHQIDSITTSNPHQIAAGLTNNQEPIKNISNIHQSVIDDCFAVFWEAGMRKVGRKPALAKFTRLVKSLPTEIDPMEFSKALDRDIKARLKANQLGFDLMHPTTYLNNERWSDEQYNEVNSGAPEKRSAEPASQQVSDAILASIYSQQQEGSDDLVGHGDDF